MVVVYVVLYSAKICFNLESIQAACNQMLNFAKTTHRYYSKQRHSMIQIVIIDDHKLFSDGLASMLQNHRNINVVAQIYDSREALTKIQQISPDVILIDFKMPYINGLELSKMLLAQDANLKMLILSMYEEERFIQDFKDVGVQGYLVKTVAIEEVIQAIEDIHEGKQVFEFPDKNDQNPHKEDTFIKKLLLSPREEDVVKLIRKGLNTRQIAEQLNISYYTAETHRKNIYTKLGIKGGERILLNLMLKE
jgi:DNA-binding NarL/FixJ family response regulator